jgi:hypothetical protein
MKPRRKVNKPLKAARAIQHVQACPGQLVLSSPKSKALARKEKRKESRAVLLAKAAASAHFTGAAVAVAFSQGVFGRDVSLVDTISVLADKIGEMRHSGLRETEVLLLSQAVALNAIFTELSTRAAANMRERLGDMDRYLRLALKAQSQCRATLETLAVIKNPPTVFARQANIAQGPQQVNNAVLLPSGDAQLRARAGNQETGQIELLEAHGERLDSETARATSAGDKAMAPMGAIHRPANRSRQGPLGTER